jgi:hypothetical protein
MRRRRSCGDWWFFAVLTMYERPIFNTFALPIVDIFKSKFMPGAPSGASQRESGSQ